jgi:pyruvate ferredoxin oxidoreductase gamma subunit
MAAAEAGAGRAVFQVRIHGRGGQGVVTAAELLSVAAFDDGRHAQAFPSFGSERTGAPVVAFCRIDERAIRTREPVSRPDALVVQDATLLHQVDVFGGLSPDGYVLINSGRSLEELGLGDWTADFRAGRLLTVGASEISRRQLGPSRPNAALLGGLAALTGVVSLDSVVQAIESRFAGALAPGNVAAARECHETVGAALAVFAGA